MDYRLRALIQVIVGFVVVVCVLGGATGIIIVTAPMNKSARLSGLMAAQPSSTPGIFYTPTQDATPTDAPNMVATQMFLVNALGTKQAELSAQNIALHQIDLDIARSAAEVEKYKAAQADADARLAEAAAASERAKADQMAVANEAQANEARLLDLQAQIQSGNVNQIIAVSVVALMVAFSIVALRVIRIRPPEPTPVVAPEPEAARVHVVDDNTAYPIPAPPGDYDAFLKWAHHARMGGLLAYNKVVGAGLPYSSNSAYAPVWEWAHKYKVVERDTSGRVVLSKRGEAYCDQQLDAAQFKAHPEKCAPRQAPSQDGNNDGGDVGQTQ